MPPVGELVFEDPPGDVHIKYGYIKNDDYFVIKVASGFYDNVELGLPPADGLMLVFSQKTAQLECILLDECHLTNVRTAAAGAVVAKYLAPSTGRAHRRLRRRGPGQDAGRGAAADRRLPGRHRLGDRRARSSRPIARP